MTLDRIWLIALTLLALTGRNDQPGAFLAGPFIVVCGCCALALVDAGGAGLKRFREWLGRLP